jgi:N-acetylglucosaminyl-diphospho-decaprenol L-rhamnosyltransferase
MIGVVVVTFRGGAAVAAALDALARARERLLAEEAAATVGGVEVVVVDNASRDGTVERVRRHAPWAQLVELPQNRGFAAGCNVGIDRLDACEAIVLLNPDVEVREDFLVRLSALQWTSQMAARGPAVFDGRGAIEQSARGFPRARTALLGRSSWLARVRPQSRLLRSELVADPDAGARFVDWVSGACLIAPAERFRTVGALDEGFFMYWEDADWCLRARQLGYRVLYDPALVVTHRQGASSEGRPLATTIAFHRSAYRYWRLHLARSPISRLAGAVALTIRCALKLTAQAVARVGGARRATRAGR